MTRIDGVMTLANGTTVPFALVDAAGQTTFMQWGHTTDVLADTAPVLTALVDGLVSNDIVLGEPDEDHDENDGVIG